MKWTAEHSAAARREGWDIFDVYDSGTLHRVPMPLGAFGDRCPNVQTLLLSLKARIHVDDKLCMDAIKHINASERACKTS